jgi:parallel beta-helix repeat protein
MGKPNIISFGARRSQDRNLHRKITVATIGFLLLFSSLMTVAHCYSPINEASTDSTVNSMDGCPQEDDHRSVLTDHPEREMSNIEGHESLGSTASTFIRATTVSPTTLDPSIAYDAASYEVLQNVYETLIWYNEGNTSDLVPMLATEVPTVENGGISPDGHTYTFNIREGVYFHDLSMLTGYDVEYSIERVLTMNDPESPCWMLAQVLYELWPGPGVELDPYKVDSAVTVNPSDPFEVSFHLCIPYSPFLQILAMPLASIISLNYVEAHGGVIPITQNEWMRTHEAGTGPFWLSDLSETNVTLSKNNYYWREEAELDQATITLVEDAEERKQMLINGTVDSAELPREMRDELILNPDMRIVEGDPSFIMEFLGFNQQMNMGLDVGSVPADFFADPNVRRAFVHAFDYEIYLDMVLENGAIRPNGPIPLGMFAYDPSVPNYTMDLALAADFLNKTVYGASGFHLILYYNAGNDEREAACFLLKEGLESIPIAGAISITIQPLDWPTYLNALYDKDLPILYLGWSPDYADPDDYVNPLLHSYGPYPYFLGFDNATLDDMIIDAVEGNSTFRTEMYQNISQSCYDNAYYLWTAQYTSFHVERTWVTGYYFNPMYGGLYYYPLSGLDRGPSEPLNFTLRAYVDRIELDWDPPLDSGVYDLLGYRIYKGGTESSLIPIEEVDYPTTYWTDYDFTDGESLYYAVSAVNEMFEGNMSEILHIHAPDEPGEITSFGAVSGNGTVELWWAEPYSNGTIGIDHYNIYRGLSLGEEILIDTVDGLSFQYLDLNVTNGVTYYYCISAENTKGEGEPSIVRAAKPLPVVDHAPIRINNDAELISMAALEGWSGDGSEYTPYSINGLSIDAGSATSGIYIGNVSLYFQITESIVMNSSLVSPSIPEGAMTIFNSSNGMVYNCTFDQCDFGIIVWNSTNIMIHMNLMNSNVFAQFYISGSDDVVIGNNTMLLSDYGIVFENSNDCRIEANSIIGMPGRTCNSVIIGYGSNNTVRYNHIDRCYRAIMIGMNLNAQVYGNQISNVSQMGISIVDSERCAIEDNTIDSSDGETIGIGVSGNEMEIRNNWVSGLFVGMGVSSSTNISIESNEMVNSTGAGIELTQSSSITIIENICSDGYGGLFLYEIEDCTLWKNKISSNGFIGLEMYNSLNITVFENMFEDNAEYAVMVVGGGENLFIENSFKENNGASDSYSVDHVQAYDDTETDLWNLSEGTGNYWSDWTSPDDNFDSIVDVPYVLDGGSLSDHFPMTRDPFLPSVTIIWPWEGMCFNVSSITVQWIGEIGLGEIDHYMISLDGGEWIDLGLTTSYDVSGLPDGEHEFRVKATGSYGYSSTTSVHFVIDVSDPTLLFCSPSEGAILNMNNVRLTWNGEDLVSGIDHYEVRLDGGEWIDVGTNTSFLTAPLAEGWHHAEVRAFDGASNSANDTVTFMVDTIAPSVQILAPSSGEIITSISLDIEWQGSDTGTGISSYFISIDGSDWINMAYATSYHIASIDEGEHEVRVRLVDNGTNEAIATIGFYIDISGPALTIGSPLEDAALNSSDVIIEWSGQDAGSGIDHFEISVDSSSWIDVGTSTSYAVNDLVEGQHKLEIVAFDNAGFMTSESINFTIDTVAPILDIILPSDGLILNLSSVSVNWMASDLTTEIQCVEICLDSGDWINVTGTSSYEFTSLSDGDHSVVIRAFDVAGNLETASVTFTTDTAPPEISSVQPADGDFLNSSEVAVSWAMSDLTSGILYCEISLDDSEWSNLGSNTSISLPGLEDGVHTLKLIVHDLAGNSANTTLSFMVDTVAPVVEVLPPLCAGDRVEISWDGSDEGSGIDHWEIRLNEGDWQNLGLSTGINLTSLSDGWYNFTIRAVDRAGNVKVGNIVSWLVDTSSPTLVSCSPQGSEIAINTQIILVFSENISSCGVSLSPGTIGTSVLCSGSEVVITLAEELQRATTYSVSINASDLRGNCVGQEWSFSTSTKVLISGEVLDENGDPISGCNISIGDQVIACTDSTGFFQCEIDAGDYTLNIEKEGFEAVTESITVTDGEEFDLGEVNLAEESGAGSDQTLVLAGAVIAVVVVALAVGVMWLRKR